MFKDIYNFQVNDVFQYEGWSWGLDPGGGPVSAEWFIKYTVLQKDSLPGIYQYEVTKVGFFRYTNAPPNTQYYNNIETLEFIDSLNHSCNYFQNELVDNPLEDTYETNFGIMRVYPDTGIVISKKIGSEQYFNENSLYAQLNEEVLVPCCVLDFLKKYSNTLGMVHYSCSVGEFGYGEKLIGYVKKGDTTGIVYDDDWLLGIDRPEKRLKGVSIFPNPAADRITVEIQRQECNACEMNILSMDGRLETSLRFSHNRFVVDISKLPEGVHMIRITCADQVFTEKLIVF